MNALEEVQKIWETISTGESIIDEKFDMALQKKLLDIFHVGNYFFYVVNVRRSQIEYMSPEITEILGYGRQTGLADLLTLLHPDDIPYFLNFEAAVERFFGQLTGQDLFKYKVQYDFRLKKSDGNYTRILHQFVIIQHDAEDIKTFAVDTDISHLKTSGASQLSFIGLDGAPSYFNVSIDTVFNPVKSFFTKREREVLQALAAGMNSHEISDALSISKHTVDVHRKNMLKKTDAKSTYEILQKAFNKGWV